MNQLRQPSENKSTSYQYHTVTDCTTGAPQVNCLKKETLVKNKEHQQPLTDQIER